MFRPKCHKTRMNITPLPTEIWLIIFDFVIEEGIIRLEDCDHTTFPHIWTSFSASVRRYQFYGSYWRLRLVCRRFNDLLGARPWQSFSDFSLLHLSITTKALYLDLEALFKPNFQPLLAQTSTCGRLVYLDVECRLSPSSVRLNLSDLLNVERTFGGIQRLTLRLVKEPRLQPEVAFWSRLNRAFPLLTTLVVVTPNHCIGRGIPRLEDDEVTCLERLEILYFSNAVTYSGCHFPRLRHASIWKCTRRELEILTRSPYLESLLIRSYLRNFNDIDVTSCSRLKLLGFPDQPSVVLLGSNLPMEHIRLYSNTYKLNPDLIEQFLGLPMLCRITVEFSAYDLRDQWLRTSKLRSTKFVLSSKSSTNGDLALVYERGRVATDIMGGALRKAWSKMRW